MAKAKTLAALAGLAGLAYAMNKDKSSGMTPEQNDTLANANRVSKMSEDSDTLARVNRNMSAGQSAADDTNAGVLKALATPKTAPNDQAGNQGVLSPKSITPKAVPKLETYTTRKDPREAETDMTRGRPAMVNKNPNGTIEAPAASNRTDAMRNTSRAAAAADRLRKTGKQSFKSGGMTSSASSRADGIASRGKTRGKIC
jgi:hypothetical protein